MRHLHAGRTDARLYSCDRACFWNLADGRPLDNAWKDIGQVPARTPLSDATDKDLKKRGFKFVGSTIVYAHMQVTGMVNDPTVDCFRHRELARAAQRK